jgi:penicillin-binding protein 2
MAIAGLLYKVCNVHTSVNCPGSFHLGRTWRCWRRHNHVEFTGALAQSCDVWFYNLGHRLEIERMAKVAKQFGIGSATGIDLPDESRRSDGGVGTMPNREWKRAKHHDRWWPGDTINCVIGQGYVQASPLQMALACAGVANSGKIYRPFLVEEIREPKGKLARRAGPEVTSEVNAPAQDFRLVQAGMRAAVTGGTARVCNMPDVAVGGKTGSAENPGHAAHGWFICFAPLDKPRIAVACVIEHGRHGATTAAPVCRAILDVYFGKKKPQEVGQGMVQVSGD